MPYIDGIKPNPRKLFRRVGMAVNSGAQTRLNRLALADDLEKLYVTCHDLGLWVQGNPFHETLRAVSEQLREGVMDEDDEQLDRQYAEQDPEGDYRKQLPCANCGAPTLVAPNVDRTVCDRCFCDELGTIVR